MATTKKKPTRKKKANGKANGKGNGAGRPHIQLTKEQKDFIVTAATYGGTKSEIAQKLGISESTLSRNYDDLYKSGCDERNLTLRQLQFEQAKGGDTTMLIWLGKQWLGQRNEPIPEDLREQLMRGLSDKPMNMDEWEKKYGQDSGYVQ